VVITLIFEKNADFFAENWGKSPKIVTITSTPASPFGVSPGAEFKGPIYYYLILEKPYHHTYTLAGFGLTTPMLPAGKIPLYHAARGQGSML
jgi:hypothetical protein